MRHVEEETGENKKTRNWIKHRVLNCSHQPMTVWSKRRSTTRCAFRSTEKSDQISITFLGGMTQQTIEEEILMNENKS